MKKFLCTFLMAVMMLGILTVGAGLSAARDLKDETAVAEDLKSLGLFKGVSDTDFALERPASRVEALVMLIRMLGKEADALATDKPHPFTDVPAWADKYVAYAYAEGLTKGVSATEFGSTDANAMQYLTFVLRALGYSDTNGADFTWDNPFDLAKKVGILTSDVVTDSFLRADVALVSKNALSAVLKGTKTTLADKLIADKVFTQAQYEAAFPPPEEPIVMPAIPASITGKQYQSLDKYPKPMIFSFKSEEHLEANSVLHKNSQKPNESGIYEFSNGALKLSYSEPAESWQGQYRVMFAPETVNYLNSAHTLAQITYRTNAKSGELRLHNNGSSSDFVVLASDVSVSGGKWVHSTLVELTSTMVARLNQKQPVTICLHTTEKNISFEIRELTIFCSPEQAINYNNSNNGGTAAIKPIVYKLGSAADILASGVKFMDFGPKNNLPEHEEGIFDYVTVDGEKALQLKYDKHNYAGNYRVMFKPNTEVDRNLFKQSDTWYVRVRYKALVDTMSNLAVFNNGTNKTIDLETSFSSSKGWQITYPMQLSPEVIGRFTSNMHVTLGFYFPQENLEVYVSEIAFFPSLNAACEYYGDIEVSSATQFSMDMTNTTATVQRASVEQNDGEPVWERDSKTGAVILKYTPYDSYNMYGYYRLMPSFAKVTDQMRNAQYFRIVYKATNPKDEAGPVALKVVSNANNAHLTVDDDVKNTGDKWTVSPVQQMPPVIHERWLGQKQMHCTVSFMAAKAGGEYAIREIVFFDTYDDAAAFTLDESTSSIKIADNAIDSYAIVIPAEAGRRTTMAAEALKGHIRSIAGVDLDIITDAEAERAHEIVVGNTTRTASQPYYNGKTGKYVTGELQRENFVVAVSGDDLLITAGSEIAVQEGMTKFLEAYFGYNAPSIPKEITFNTGFFADGTASITTTNYKFDDPAPVANPIVYTDNFDDEQLATSPDYWVEAYATDNWLVRADGNNRVYATNAKAFTYTRLHVYERDIDYTVKMRFDQLSADSDAGVLARYNHEGAYIRAGYKNGEWYLKFAENPESNVYILDTEKAEVKAGTWYTIRITVQKNDVKVYVDGNLILESSYVTHLSPGPMGMFAQNASVSFDDVSVTLVSGQGRILKGVVDSTFWNQDTWLCSGSVLEMKDGKLRYIHSSEGVQQVSTDKGLTWKTEKFTDVTTDCVNIYRLNSGNLIKMMEETIGGVLYHVTYTSTDDGVTWTRGGKLAAHDYKGYGTMIQTIENDKFFQASNGRLFVSQNYQGSIPKGEPNDHMKVFNEMWYSDDEGKTWTQSKTSSFDMTNSTHIGESKVIETADGALLWITSWNNLGYIIASESTDNGVTWGEFYNLTQFPCSISSFGIMRDEYADNNTTYYLAWVYNEPNNQGILRSRLSMAKTTDGRNWQFLGDVYRWENTMQNSVGSGTATMMNHIVDPFMTVTKDYLFVGSGFSARRSYTGSQDYHNIQHQKIFRIEKSTLVPYEAFPNY